MDNSVRPAIEKIKLQEHDNELRLKEKRELNSTILSLNRAIHDATINLEKLKKEYKTLIDTTDKLRGQLLIETIRKQSFLDQVNECQKELIDLQKASIEGVSSVWEKRSKLFENVKSTSEKCDIWALLIKPSIEIKPNIVQAQSNEQVTPDDTKLKAAINRKNKAIAMRNLLLNEPDVGEEFMRTRNALQYSMEIMTQEQND